MKWKTFAWFKNIPIWKQTTKTCVEHAGYKKGVEVKIEIKRYGRTEHKERI